MSNLAQAMYAAPSKQKSIKSEPSEESALQQSIAHPHHNNTISLATGGDEEVFQSAMNQQRQSKRSRKEKYKSNGDALATESSSSKKATAMSCIECGPLLGIPRLVHIASKHLKHTIFTCNHCIYTTNYPVNMNKHARMRHPDATTPSFVDNTGGYETLISRYFPIDCASNNTPLSEIAHATRRSARTAQSDSDACPAPPKLPRESQPSQPDTPPTSGISAATSNAHDVQQPSSMNMMQYQQMVRSTQTAPSASGCLVPMHSHNSATHNTSSDFVTMLMPMQIPIAALQQQLATITHPPMVFGTGGSSTVGTVIGGGGGAGNACCQHHCHSQQQQPAPVTSYFPPMMMAPPQPNWFMPQQQQQPMMMMMPNFFGNGTNFYPAQQQQQQQ